MDKEEYRQKLDELTGYVKKKDFKKALDLADEIDWRRVKSLNTLNMVADIYEVNKDYERAKEILELALGRASIGHSILYRLVEVCLKLGEVDEAEKYFNEFSKTSKNDNSRCILQYKLYKAKNAPLEAQIDVLEEYREREYTERWAYELALLYSKAGDRKKCVDACDDLILWFGEGKYVLKAMELKKKYEPLLPSQEQAYEKMKKKYRQSGNSEEEVSTEEDASERADTFAAQETAEDTSAGLTRVMPAKNAAQGTTEAPVRKDAVPETRAAEKRPSTAKQESAPSGGVSELKDKFASNFRNIFHPQEDEDDTEEETEAPVREKPAKAASAPEADEYENGLKIKKLEKEDLSTDVTKTAAASGKKPVSDYEKGKTADFDLNAFLAETAGSFSNEIKGQSFEETDQSAPATSDVHSESPAEANVNAGVSNENRQSTAAQAAPTSAVKEEEKTEPAPEKVQDKPAVEEVETEPVADDDGLQPVVSEDAVEEPVSDTQNSEQVNKEAAVRAAAQQASQNAQDAAAEKPVVKTPAADALKAKAAEPTVSKSAADAIAGLAAGSTRAPEKDKTNTNAGSTAAGTAGGSKPAAEQTAVPAKKKPHYIEELEIPDPEPTEEEKKSHTHTITLNTIGENTVPISIDKILSEETPEERRIRILNKAKPTRMSEDQRKIFTYFARVPGMDGQILEAINGVYQHAGERTSLHGNIAIMGARGTGKSRLAHGLVVAMCKDLGMDAAKVARISGKHLNERDPAKVVSLMAGGFLMIEDIADVNEETLDQLNQAMEFRTDCMVLIIEDEKTRMRAFLKEHPQFASKFEKVISIPVFTNDELVTFARTYATENGCKIDDMAILALYTMIGNIQSEEEPTTISTVKKIIDNAILRATKGRRKKGRSDAEKTGKWLVLHEKDFSLN